MKMNGSWPWRCVLNFTYRARIHACTRLRTYAGRHAHMHTHTHACTYAGTHLCMKRSRSLRAYVILLSMPECDGLWKTHRCCMQSSVKLYYSIVIIQEIFKASTLWFRVMNKADYIHIYIYIHVHRDNECHKSGRKKKEKKMCISTQLDDVVQA